LLSRSCQRDIVIEGGRVRHQNWRTDPTAAAVDGVGLKQAVNAWASADNAHTKPQPAFRAIICLISSSQREAL
jgi:hypothetical protein